MPARTCLLVVAVLVLCAPVHGQKATRIAFDVATVRPSAPGTRGAQRVLPGRIEFVGTSLRTVLFTAFRIENVVEASSPAWLLDARFDIQGTYPAGATAAQVPEMLQTLLRDRFGLVTHTEPRRVDGYELVVGKDGIKMREVEPVDELNHDFTTPSGQKPAVDFVADTAEGPVRSMVIPGEVGSRTVTARSRYETRTTLNRTTLVDATRISMRELVSLLKVNLDRPVYDRTGLTGVYQFKVELDVSQMALRIVTADKDGNPINRDPTGVSTFKAIEGLGLKLQELRAPLDVLIVDKIERTPTEN